MKLLKGIDVANQIDDKTREKLDEIRRIGITPTLAIVRVGEDEGQISYERGAEKRADKVGINVKKYILDSSISEKELLEKIRALNEDDNVHGILLMRPLPSGMNEKKICDEILPEKDVDCCNTISLGNVFAGDDNAIYPCTAKAALEILKYYGVNLAGKRIVVIGRSLVIGKPVAMLLLAENGTVTICHSKTEADDMKKLVKEADIVVIAIGKAKAIDKTYFRDGQTIIDVGINVDDSGKLCGDVDAHMPFDVTLTPVPGGVGSCTTSVLMSNLKLLIENNLK